MKNETIKTFQIYYINKLTVEVSRKRVHIGIPLITCSLNNTSAYRLNEGSR